VPPVAIEIARCWAITLPVTSTPPSTSANVASLVDSLFNIASSLMLA
jgi:hypothetical protein